MQDLGCLSNAEVLDRYVELSDKRVADLGCGDLTFSKILVEAGAEVFAVDPDSVQASLNRQNPVPGITFFETGADQLPFEDGLLDGVFFSYSLHHIPAELYEQVFAEVFRVLRPGGFLYIIEPIDCPANQIMILFHDEEQERAAAQTAIDQLARDRFENCHDLTYHGHVQFESFEEYAVRYASRSFNSIYSEADVRAPRVQEAFERLGQPDYRFETPKRVFVGLGKK